MAHDLKLTNSYNPKTKQTTIKAWCTKCKCFAYRVIEFEAPRTEYTKMAIAACKELNEQECKG